MEQLELKLKEAQKHVTRHVKTCGRVQGLEMFTIQQLCCFGRLNLRTQDREQLLGHAKEMWMKVAWWAWVHKICFDSLMLLSSKIL